MTNRVILYLGDAPSLLTVAALDRVNKSVPILGKALWKLGRNGVVAIEPQDPAKGSGQVVTPVGVGETQIACIEQAVKDGVVVSAGHDELTIEVRPPNGNHLVIEIGQPDPSLIVPRPVAPANLTPEETAERAEFITSIDARVKAGNLTMSQANVAIAESDAAFVAARAKAKPTQGPVPGEVKGAGTGRDANVTTAVESDTRRTAREDAAARLGLPKSATWADIADAQGKL